MNSTQFFKKFENFWFYYKWHTIAIVVTITVIAFSVNQCASVVKPDVKIWVVSMKTPYNYVVNEEIIKDLTPFVTDINKDGVKKLEIANIDITGDDIQFKMASRNKLMAEIAGGDSIVFLLDKSAYNSFTEDKIPDKIKTIIPSAPAIDDFAIPVTSIDALKGKDHLESFKDYYLIIRRYKGSAIENNKNDILYNNSIEFLKNIIITKK